jgi:hypothetical protein
LDDPAASALLSGPSALRQCTATDVLRTIAVRFHLSSKSPLKYEIAARQPQHLVYREDDYLQDVDAGGTLAISSTGT